MTSSTVVRALRAAAEEVEEKLRLHATAKLRAMSIVKVVPLTNEANGSKRSFLCFFLSPLSGSSSAFTSKRVKDRPVAVRLLNCERADTVSCARAGDSASDKPMLTAKGKKMFFVFF